MSKQSDFLELLTPLWNIEQFNMWNPKEHEKLKKHSDLLNEFYFFVQNGRFKSFYPKTSEGFTAQQLFETTYLSPLGAYNYLIYLRENPKEALEDLRKGLPRK